MTTQVLSVTLPSEVIYVSGTVNETAYTWTLIDGAWTAIVERAADDTYNVALTAVTAAGTSANYELVLYYGLLSLITDRTQSDVNRVKALAAKGWASMTDSEKAEWRSGTKGAYNATDLNRVGAALNYIASRLNSCGIKIQVFPKIDWQVADIPSPDQMTAYLSDVATIRAAFPVGMKTPDVPSDMVKLTYTEANNIERILLDVDALITNMIAAFFYSGELYANEI